MFLMVSNFQVLIFFKIYVFHLCTDDRTSHHTCCHTSTSTTSHWRLRANNNWLLLDNDLGLAVVDCAGGCDDLGLHYLLGLLLTNNWLLLHILNLLRLLLTLLSWSNSLNNPRCLSLDNAWSAALNNILLLLILLLLYSLLLLHNSLLAVLVNDLLTGLLAYDVAARS